MNRHSASFMMTFASVFGCPVLADEGDVARDAELFPIRCGACHTISEIPEEKIGPSLDPDQGIERPDIRDRLFVEHDAVRFHEDGRLHSRRHGGLLLARLTGRNDRRSGVSSR
jgi:hypothetical protein